MLSTKEQYMKACMQSPELHAMTDDERAQLQSHLRGMYIEIEKICDKHNLRMCAAYGTALGALRHHGFIPWDDDMDLVMPREDYDKFVKEYAQELPSNLKVYSPNTINGGIYRFAKVVDTNTRFLTPGRSEDVESDGIFIDIFPLEGTSNNKVSIWWKHKISCALMLIASSVMEYESSKHDDLYKRLMCSVPEGARTYNLRQMIGKLFSFRRSRSWFSTVDNFTKCKKIKAGYSVPVGGADIRYFKPVDVNVYFPARKIKFDDIEVYVPNNIEKHCELEYGDWTWIPPVEERWQHFLKEIRFKI